jgi:hypothetical protein
LQSSIGTCLVDIGAHYSFDQISEDPSCKVTAQVDLHRRRKYINAPVNSGGVFCARWRVTEAGDQAGARLHRKNKKHLHQTNSSPQQGNYKRFASSSPHQVNYNRSATRRSQQERESTEKEGCTTVKDPAKKRRRLRQKRSTGKNRRLKEGEAGEKKQSPNKEDPAETTESVSREGEGVYFERSTPWRLNLCTPVKDPEERRRRLR